MWLAGRLRILYYNKVENLTSLAKILRIGSYYEEPADTCVSNASKSANPNSIDRNHFVARVLLSPRYFA
jgi:hypothetical protein